MSNVTCVTTVDRLRVPTDGRRSRIHDPVEKELSRRQCSGLEGFITKLRASPSRFSCTPPHPQPYRLEAKKLKEEESTCAQAKVSTVSNGRVMLSPSSPATAALRRHLRRHGVPTRTFFEAVGGYPQQGQHGEVTLDALLAAYKTVNLVVNQREIVELLEAAELDSASATDGARSGSPRRSPSPDQPSASPRTLIYAGKR